MTYIEIPVHGALSYGPSEENAQAVSCPTCHATHAHTVRGDLTDTDIPVTLTCVNGHNVPIPAGSIDPRELLFTVAMRAE
ncbi:hypothetical protein [Streptomyces sp. NPDC058335]|uniref:hypothetical protein n=1 Tax=Streptomyces sp. NPDC058335 TaxID=3346451 RepID=UPI003646BD6F